MQEGACGDGPVLTPAAALVRLSFLVQSLYGRLAGEHDLTPQQAQLLCIIKDQPRAMGQLVQMLRLDKSSVSGLVDRVEQRGLVRRQPSAADRRAVNVAVTPRGRRLAQAFYNDTSTHLDQIVEHLAPDDRAELARIISYLVLAEAVPAVFGQPAG